MREPSSGRLVVVADDERDIADLLTANLVLEGYRVETVYDGEAALEAIRSLDPDFVLLDVMMPKLDGLEVLRELKGNAATQDIPVIMLTAKAGDDDVWAGWQAGANYYLTKPFDLDEVIKYLHHLEGAELLDELSGSAADATP